MRCFLIGFVGFIIAGVVALVTIPLYGNYAALASVSQTISAVAPLRNRIAELLTQKGAGTSMSLAPPKDATVAGADYLKIAADGTIIVRSAKHGQVLVFEPSVRDNAVTWKCVGSKPERNIPSSCH